MSNAPSTMHSEIPSISMVPSVGPSAFPSTSKSPSARPSTLPSTSKAPSTMDSAIPSTSMVPSTRPSTLPSSSMAPSALHSAIPSFSMVPSVRPSTLPSSSIAPSIRPSALPSMSNAPSTMHSEIPSISMVPSVGPSAFPSASKSPSAGPSTLPSMSKAPSTMDSAIPSTSMVPSIRPSTLPSSSMAPSIRPSTLPSFSIVPSAVPSKIPSSVPLTNWEDLIPFEDFEGDTVQRFNNIRKRIDNTFGYSGSKSILLIKRQSLVSKWEGLKDYNTVRGSFRVHTKLLQGEQGFFVKYRYFREGWKTLAKWTIGDDALQNNDNWHQIEFRIDEIPSGKGKIKIRFQAFMNSIQEINIDDVTLEGSSVTASASSPPALTPKPSSPPTLSPVIPTQTPSTANNNNSGGWNDLILAEGFEEIPYLYFDNTKVISLKNDRGYNNSKHSVLLVKRESITSYWIPIQEYSNLRITFHVYTQGLSGVNGIMLKHKFDSANERWQKIKWVINTTHLEGNEKWIELSHEINCEEKEKIKLRFQVWANNMDKKANIDDISVKGKERI